MTALLEALANIVQFVVPALLIAWADRPLERSGRVPREVTSGED